MKERPILFSGPMVRAILSGAKTQTRRILRNQGTVLGAALTVPAAHEHILSCCPYGVPGDRLWVRETLWVSECGKWFMYDGPQAPSDSDIFNEHERYIWQTSEMFERGEKPRRGIGSWSNAGRYVGRGPRRRWVPAFDVCGVDAERPNEYSVRAEFRKHKPGIFMPRWASRLTLEVVSVHVERLRDIEVKPRDAWAEGCRCSCTAPVPMCRGNVEEFQRLWQQINGKRAPWESNPFVWCITFRKVD